MRRVFPPYAYGPGPRDGCWWDDTIAAPVWPEFRSSARVDVAIVGAGYTGASAALHLAQNGASVAVLEASTPGWGASGRNGGFCCLGGAALDAASMVRRYGQAATEQFDETQRWAVDFVARILKSHNIDADTHSRGETVLAHSPRALRALRTSADVMAKAGKDPGFVEGDALRDAGLAGPMFYGALTHPTGFALNPRKYLFGLFEAAQTQGVRVFQNSPATRITRSDKGFSLRVGHAELHADQVIVATNGYSSDDLPSWMAGRYMPAQSSVLVTRPLTDSELDAQGWRSDQMSYDTRNLLHYFRLMPDRRFLFGMRGGLRSSPRTEAKARTQVRRDFDALFPSWRSVETTHSWSGFVCLTRSLVPFVGEVPNQPGLYAGFGYHGNGVAMGTLSGKVLADLASGKAPETPGFMQSAPNPFPFKRARRLIMPAVYAGLKLADRF